MRPWWLPVGLGVAAGFLVVTAWWMLGRGGEQNQVGPTIPMPTAVSADAETVAALQRVLRGIPAPAGETDREQVKSLLGNPGAFEVSFELADGGRGERMIRYETWFYFELGSAFEFADGDVIGNMPVDDVRPLAILPRQYAPEMFRREMTVDDIKRLVAAPDALVRIDAPAELGVNVVAYYGEQLMAVFDEAGLALVQTLPLDAGGEQ